MIPVRFNGAPAGMFAGEDKWRAVPDFDHTSLCQAFGLDQIRFYFDLTSSCRGIGSATQGSGGQRGSRIVNGFVMFTGLDKPVAKLTICFGSEKFKDVDPMSERDFFDLSYS